MGTINSYANDDHIDTALRRITTTTMLHTDKCSEQLLQAIADALWGEGADTPWSPDTLDAIADAIRTERPDLFTSRT
jgi:hypothetical protein